MKPELVQLLSRVHELYRQALSESAQARKWLMEQGVESAELIERFQLGFASGDLKKILPKDARIEKSLKELGVISGPGKGEEHLAGCLIIPLYDFTSRLVGLAGYPLEGGEVRFAGEQGAIFNWQAMKNHSEAALNDDPLKALVRIAKGDEAVMALPQDEWTDFTDATFRELAPHSVRVENTRRRQAIVDRLKQLGIGQADSKDAVQSETVIENGFSTKFARRQYIVQAVAQDNPRHLRALVRAVGSTPGRFHLDAMDLYSSRDRAAFIREASFLFGEDSTLIEVDLTRLITMAEEHLKKNARTSVVQVSEENRKEAIELLKDPKLLDIILKDIEQLGIVGEEENKLAGYLIAVSRKMDDPLSMLILSRSAAGKSTLSETIASVVPPEDVIRLTRLTGQALFYQKNQSLRHKLLVVEEESGVAQAAYPLRILQSAKRLAVVTAQGAHEVEGPVAVIVTTTNTDLGDETKSRFLVVSIDESQKQTKAIQEAQRRRETGLASNREQILKRHHGLQRCLQNFQVVNPYAPYLSFPDHNLTTRREHPKYLALIRAVTFLRQYQRKEKDGVIQVELEDIEVANRLANAFMGQSLDDLSPPARRLLDTLFSSHPKGLFTRREIGNQTQWGSTQLWTYLKELSDREFVIDRGGRPRQFELAWDGREGKVLLGLASIGDIRANFGRDSASFGKTNS